MWISVRVDARLLDADVARPYLAITEKKTLIRRKAIDGLRRWLAPKSFLVCAIGDCQAAEIGDAFAFHELAVFVQPRFHLETVKFLRNAVAARLEILIVLRRPPIAQISFRIELCALIVEAVRHFVADDGADSSVIDCIVGIRIKKWRLQDAGG